MVILFRIFLLQLFKINLRRSFWFGAISSRFVEEDRTRKVGNSTNTFASFPAVRTKTMMRTTRAATATTLLSTAHHDIFNIIFSLIIVFFKITAHTTEIVILFRIFLLQLFKINLRRSFWFGTVRK